MKKSEILERTQGGLSIYRKLLGEIPDRGKVICNPFREDKRPSLSIYLAGDRYRHKDFASPEYSGDAFNLAATYYKLDTRTNWGELLERIQTEILGSYPTPIAWTKPEATKAQQVFYSPEEVAQFSGSSIFTEHLAKHVGSDRAQETLQAYPLGQMGYEKTVFWLTNSQGKHTAGKVTKYHQRGDILTKKDQQGRSQTHYLKPEGVQSISRELYGAHLIPKNPGKPVVIVEAEDTAIMCAAAWGNEFIWTASGGTLSAAHCAPCIGRNVLVMPDFDILADSAKLEGLNKTIQAMNAKGISAKLWPLLEKLHADSAGLIDDQRRAKMDARDYIEAVPSSLQVTG